MPRPNEHSCDINSGYKILGQMSRSHEGKRYQVLIGKAPDGKTDDAIYHYPKDIWDAGSARNHCISKDGTFHAASQKMSDEPEFYELKDVDLVVKGKWKSQSGSVLNVTDKVLDNILTAFNELKGKVNVKFKLGHDDSQKLIQADGYPNIGIINSLKKVADRIKGHIIRIPKKVMDLINVGAYNEISPELTPSYYDSTTGKTYRNILFDVALLGEQHKAMKSLSDIHSFYFANNLDFEPEYSNIALNFTEPYILIGEKRTINLTAEEVKKMDDEKRIRELEEEGRKQEEQIKKFTEDNKKLTKDLEDSKTKIKATEEEKKKVQDGLDKFEEAGKASKINEFIEQGIKDGKILPAQKDNVFAMISAVEGKTVKFTVQEDGKPVEKEGTMIDLYKAISYATPINLVKMTEETIQETEDKTASDQKKKLEFSTGMKVVDDDIDKKAKAYAEEHKVDYDVALKEIS